MLSEGSSSEATTPVISSVLRASPGLGAAEPGSIELVPGMEATAHGLWTLLL